MGFGEKTKGLEGGRGYGKGEKRCSLNERRPSAWVPRTIAWKRRKNMEKRRKHDVQGEGNNQKASKKKPKTFRTKTIPSGGEKCVYGKKERRQRRGEPKRSKNFSTEMDAHPGRKKTGDDIND